jgi:sulfite reductase (NADPH) flavoprotein alpha-component
MAESISKLTILYATETGNSQDLAERTAEKAEELGFEVEILNAADYDANDLASVEALVFFGSTWGEGEPPESSWDFHDALCDGDGIDCSNLKFAVVGLGDREYELFCEFGKKVDAALAKNGGTRLVPRADLDAGFDSQFGPWSKKFFAAIQPA